MKESSLAIDFYGSLIVWIGPHEYFHQGAFSGAILTYERMYFSDSYIEIN
ncbi:hypothetical protein SDC9_144601 [bioreactor metagenome]|uniref:Uncharacterized protein n=1 Tax=bioreactor metagenome TaxID=1076179 RepID=A0A645E876_9ZZZZ